MDECRSDADCTRMMLDPFCSDSNGKQLCTCKKNKLPVLVNKLYECKDR